VTFGSLGAVSIGRISSLDGLRGVAAVVVVLHHCLLTIPAFAAPYFGQTAPASVAWFVYSPLHLVWAGGEAVFVFFILSGFVLTLPVIRRTKFSYASYYPSRFVRLYLPALVSLLAALVIALLIPRVLRVGESAWMAAHVEPLTPLTIAHDAVLILGAHFLNSPLWSLQWEVLFSLLLPVYVFVAVRFRRLWWLTSLLVLLWVGLTFAVGIPKLAYLPMFFLGSILATQLDQLRAVASKIYELPRNALIWWSLFAAAVIGVTAFWWASPHLTGGALQATEVVVVISCWLVVVLAIVWKSASVFLNSRIVQWLGRVSFSLYLTHEPVVVSVAQLLPTSDAWLTPFIAIPIAFGAAAVFYVVVERPSHRLAKWVSRKAGRNNPAQPVEAVQNT
jgi:peptidoglycan/LPS O-acetylase OafA/YrhL